MASAKLVVLYPRPKNIEAFDEVYQARHVTLASEKLQGKTKIISTRVFDSPEGEAPFYVIAEVHFRSMHALQECAR